LPSGAPSAARQFLDATGLSPIGRVIRESVPYARELLETTHRPQHWGAEPAALGSQESFRRHFRRQSALRPIVYRDRQPATIRGPSY